MKSKDLLYLLAGLLIGGAIVFLIFQKQINNFANYYVPTKDNTLAVGAATAKFSKPISWSTALNMHDEYVRNPFPLKFSYHDPITNNVASNVTLEGLSADSAWIEKILHQKDCKKLYMMFGVKHGPINGTSGQTDDFFTTVLVGLQIDSIDHQKGDTTFKFLPNVAVDYNNPCPPFCPGHE